MFRYTRETPAFGGISLAMMIPMILNICLVLKLDNRKVVPIANEQTESQSHPEPH